MKKAVHFGAGNIGRGFIAPVLQENEYEVIFVDINNELIQQINNLNQYNVTSLSLENSTNKIVENVNHVIGQQLLVKRENDLFEDHYLFPMLLLSNPNK